MNTNYEKLKATLKKIFEIDKADLDFGIYRILNMKRDEISDFLESKLLKEVESSFSEYGNSNRDELEKKLQEAIEQAKKFGSPDPESSEPVIEIKGELAKLVDASSVEQEIYSHLHTFFSRYYEKGDFISMRRYKADTYSIPYEGEEVKMYWANHDQYYVKSSEHLRDYAFTVTDKDNKTVKIKLMEADTEKDNKKTSDNKERRFSIDKDDPFTINGDELIIKFNYILYPKATKQTKLNKESVEFLFEQEGISDWIEILKELAPTEKDKKRTLFEKHLNDYTAKNTFDYFIHKNLKGFLTREFDFYLKNEVFHLDDLTGDSYKSSDVIFQKISCLRSVAQKIISFVSQIENFQKKLWLKKKFVVSTNYIISTGHIDESLFEKIIDNEAQWLDWIDNNFIKKEDAKTADQRKSLLESETEYPLDTRYFDTDFKNQLISSIDDLDNILDGELINSDNFHALNYLQAKYSDKIKCIYIDPPYNTAASEILYKNNFKHSSWLSLMADRMRLAKNLLSEDGIMEIAIDDAEFYKLQALGEQEFGEQNHIGNVAVLHNPKGRDQAFISDAHEYTLLFAKNKKKLKFNRLKLSGEEIESKYPKSDDTGRYRELPLRRRGTAPFREDRPYMYYPFICKNDGTEVQVIPREEYEKIYVNGKFNDGYVEELKAEYEKAGKMFILPIREDGRLGRWRWGYDRSTEKAAEGIFFIRGREGAETIYHKDYANDTELPKSLWFDKRYDASTKGTNILKNILPGNEFDYPKSVFVVEDMIHLGSEKDSIILDYFAGSGTTLESTIALNRADGGNRKVICVEMGNHYNGVVIPRLKRIAFSPLWKKGKPEIMDASKRVAFKCITLESYEDVLNNLELTDRTEQQSTMFEESEKLYSDFMLTYMLNFETKGSASLVNLEKLKKPFGYKLNIAEGSAGETKEIEIDVVETFNSLLGIHVKSIGHIDGFVVVVGETGEEENTLIIWRDIEEKSNEELEKFMQKLKYHPGDTEFDHIYINGDSTIEDPFSKVKLIESELSRIMFESTEQQGSI